jgi:hypothetical protein
MPEANAAFRPIDSKNLKRANGSATASVRRSRQMMRRPHLGPPRPFWEADAYLVHRTLSRLFKRLTDSSHCLPRVD